MNTPHTSAVSHPPDDPTQAGFVTDHLALAAFLVSCGHDATLRPTGAGRFLFSFAPSEALTTDVAAFNEGNARVEPAAYDAARIALRKQMDATKGGAR
jgi:hypothetical protein